MVEEISEDDTGLFIYSPIFSSHCDYDKDKPSKMFHPIVYSFNFSLIVTYLKSVSLGFKSAKLAKMESSNMFLLE